MSIRNLLAAAIAAACVTGVASAQDQGASVSGNVSALNMDSNTSVAYTGAFEYRFNHVVGLQLELTWAPSLDTNLASNTSTLPDPASALAPLIGSIILPLPRVSNVSGRAVILSNNVRIAIPTTTTRIEPFFVAGGGIASVRKTADYTYTFPPLLGIASNLIGNTVHQVESSSLGLALTIGGGAGFRVTEHLWIDADLRLVRILGDQDKNVGRFGVSARYRF
jgi:opacity protein-like surface antigen